MKRFNSSPSLRFVLRPLFFFASSTLALFLTPSSLMAALEVDYSPQSNPSGNLDGIPMGTTVSYPITVTSPSNFPVGGSAPFHFNVLTTTQPAGVDPLVAAGFVAVAAVAPDAGKTAFTSRDEAVHFSVTIKLPLVSQGGVAGTYAWTIKEDNWPMAAGTYYNGGHFINASSVDDPTIHYPPTVTISSPTASPPYSFLQGELGHRTIPLNFQVQVLNVVDPTGDAVIPDTGLSVLLNGVQLPLASVIIDSNNTVAGTQTLTAHADLLPVEGPNSVTVRALTKNGPNLLVDPSQSFTVVVQAPPVITSPATTDFTSNTAGSFQVVATGTTASTTYSISNSIGGPVLPSWLSINSATGMLSGTPPAGAAGQFVFTITVSNGPGYSTTQSFTLTVDAPPVFTSAAQTTFTVGTAGTFTVTASGSPLPVLSVGALPSWLSFNTSTGVLSGTPPSGTGSSFTVAFAANNGVGGPVNQTFTLNVKSPPAITSANNATFTVGQPGTFTVTTTGTPKPTLTGSGALPTGVTFTPGTGSNAGTGVLSGTPTSGGGQTFPLTFTASNLVGPDATQPFTLIVSKGGATVTLAGLTATYDGTPKSVTATTTPLRLAVTFTYAGSTTAPTNAGSYPVVATISDPNYQGSASDTLLIAKAPLTIIADNKTRAYGDPNPPLTASCVGFVHGDTASVISGLVLSTAATATSVPGTYDIIASGATAKNYTPSFVKDALTVTKANQTIPFGPLPTKTVGDPKFTLPATASSGLTVTYISSSTAVATVSGNTVTIVSAGSTTLTASQAGNANYNRAPNVTQTLTVAGAKSYSLCGTVFFDINYNGVFDAIGEDDDDHWNGDDHGSSSCGNGDWSDCRGSRNDRFSDRGRGSDYGDRSASRDCDNDDEQHAEDFGLGGVTVNLLNSKGKVIATLVTNADGTYCFTNLAPGTYTVSAVEPNGYDATTQTTRSATITNKNVIVRDIGMGLDLTEIRKKHADGNSDDFWHTQLDKCIKGDSKNVQVSASTCTAHTKKIGSLALSVFDDITMKSARSLLENNGRSSREQLSRQLMAAEYNYSNGAYIDGDKVLTYCFIQWGERVCKYPSAYSNSYAQWAADWFEAYNTSGGGKVGGPQ